MTEINSVSQFVSLFILLIKLFFFFLNNKPTGEFITKNCRKCCRGNKAEGSRWNKILRVREIQSEMSTTKTSSGLQVRKKSPCCAYMKTTSCHDRKWSEKDSILYLGLSGSSNQFNRSLVPFKAHYRRLFHTVLV